MYAIIGATGNTGEIVSEKLLAAGKTVRVIGRDANRLKPLVEKGATASVGTVDDAPFLTRAFSGATAVYALIPPNFKAPDGRAYQNQVGSAIARAITDAKVSHVVDLSSLGAELAEGTGPVLGLHDQEARLNSIAGLNVLHLRPTFFMENFLASLPALKQFGVFGTMLRPDLRFPTIASRDVAETATRRLLALDFKGSQVLELRGARDVTPMEITKAFGEAIGKPRLAYMQFPYEEAKQAMIGMGMSPDVASTLVQLQFCMNEEKGISAAGRTPENTTPTSIEEFAQIFAAAYRAA
jgi:uncharacterized protein YbjT (DUF2867 family)